MKRKLTRCTCRAQGNYWGSYYCERNGVCHKMRDRKWWRNLQRKKKLDKF